MCNRKTATSDCVASAIKDMVVRGAPAIGATAAFGYVIGAMENFKNLTQDRMNAVKEKLAKTRPTAVNLFWALDRMHSKFLSLKGQRPDFIIDALNQEAEKIALEDIEVNKKMGEYGQSLLPTEATVITHCNAGALATVDYGTALGMIHSAIDHGKHVSAYVDETRPYLQGARLTAWELMKLGVNTTLICDNMAGWVMKTRKVDAVIVGSSIRCHRFRSRRCHNNGKRHPYISLRQKNNRYHEGRISLRMNDVEVFAEKISAFFRDKSAVRILIKVENDLLRKQILSELFRKIEVSDPLYDTFEIDKSGNISIDQIRNVKEFLSYPPTFSSRKYVIVDEMMLMSPEASSAILKILEEPPDFSAFICFSSNLNGIFSTIKSRFLIFKPYIDPIESAIDSLKIGNLEVEDLLRTDLALAMSYQTNPEMFKNFLKDIEENPAKLFFKSFKEKSYLVLPATAERILMLVDVKNISKFFQALQPLFDDEGSQRMIDIFFNAAVILCEDLVIFNFTSYWKGLNRKSYSTYYARMKVPDETFIKRISTVRRGNVSKDLLIFWLLLNFAMLKKV